MTKNPLRLLVVVAAAILMLSSCASQPSAPTNSLAPRLSEPALASIVTSPSTQPSAPISNSYKGVFLPTGSMGGAHSAATATRLPDGRVLIAGGADSSPDLPVATAVLYDQKTGTFTPTGPLSTARDEASATLLKDGRVLVAGGSGLNGYLNSAELYDPNSGTFRVTGSMEAARAGQTSVLLGDGRVLISGGLDSQALSAAPTASAEIYDPHTGTFSKTGSMPDGRAFGVAAPTTGGRILIAGGDTVAGGRYAQLATATIFDPSTGMFTPTGSMASARDFAVAAPLSDGRVLVAGGHDASSTLATAEIFDPSSGSFVAAGTMTTGRYGAAATILVDGRVLIVGGAGPNSTQPGSLASSLSSAELFDSATQLFSLTGSMTTGRFTPLATTLPDGAVLIAGGDELGTDSKTSILSAELYQ